MPLEQFKVTEEDVLKGLRNLKTDKSTGIDGIHPRPLKELADVLAKPIHMIFKKSLETGQLPRNIADNNYRPASLLCRLYNQYTA